MAPPKVTLVDYKADDEESRRWRPTFVEAYRRCFGRDLTVEYHEDAKRQIFSGDCTIHGPKGQRISEEKCDLTHFPYAYKHIIVELERDWGKPGWYYFNDKGDILTYGYAEYTKLWKEGGKPIRAVIYIISWPRMVAFIDKHTIDAEKRIYDDCLKLVARPEKQYAQGYSLFPLLLRVPVKYLPEFGYGPFEVPFIPE